MGHMGLIILKKATCLDDPHRDVFSQNESHFSFVMHLKWPDVIRLSGLPKFLVDLYSLMRVLSAFDDCDPQKQRRFFHFCQSDQ